MLEVQTSIQETSFELKHAILFYCSNNNILATFHNVKNRKLLAGKSLSVADLEELFHSENQKQKMLYIPPEVIAWSRNEIIWFEPGKIRPIYFDVPEKNRKFLNKISGKNVRWPSLIFKISQQKLYCWAIKGNKRPGLDSKLYNPPFTNIFADYSFCPPPEFHNLKYQNIISYARAAIDIFYRGHFSHTGGNSFNSILYPEGRDRFWQMMVNELENGKCKTFPYKYLVISPKKLKDILI